MYFDMSALKIGLQIRPSQIVWQISPGNQNWKMANGNVVFGGQPNEEGDGMTSGALLLDY